MRNCLHFAQFKHCNVTELSAFHLCPMNSDDYRPVFESQLSSPLSVYMETAGAKNCSLLVAANVTGEKECRDIWRK